jgi:hypothetical protein
VGGFATNLGLTASPCIPRRSEPVRGASEHDESVVLRGHVPTTIDPWSSHVPIRTAHRYEALSNTFLVTALPGRSDPDARSAS